MPERILILGAGHAAGFAAISLRKIGFNGKIALVGNETEKPYERPSLSKAFLSGAQTQPVYLADEHRWNELKVDFHLGVSASRIDREQRTVLLTDATTLSYDRLILATGGKVRPLPLPHHSSIHYLRTTDDARALMKGAQPGKRVLVVGGGVIGLETASTLKSLGLEVTVIEASERILGRNIPAEAAQWLANAHSRDGIEIRLNCALESFTPTETGSVIALLSDGTSQEVDLVVVGIGIIPCSDIAQDAGLSVNGGVVVDAAYRSPDDANIYAIGDLAVRTRQGVTGRIETWAHAQTSARAAAVSIMGLPVEIEPTPWFWTEQCGHNLQILGDPLASDQVIERGDAVRLYLKDGLLNGAICLDQARDFAAARRLIGKAINPELAADKACDLRKALT